jgi:hypothetical protein
MPELNNVNTRAAKAAVTMLMGEEGWSLFEKLYHALDQSEYAGFQDGSDVGFKLASELHAGTATYNEEEAYDDGYLQGVKDVRLDPKGADAVVEEIVACRNEACEVSCGDDFNGEEEMPLPDFDFNVFYEGDSGDENDHPSVR